MDVHWNGNSSPIIEVGVVGNLGLLPVFTHRTTFSNYMLCGFIHFKDLPTGVVAGTVAVITSPITPPCFVDVVTPATHNITLAILNHDYGLRQTIVHGPGGTTLTPNPAPSVTSLAPSYISTVSHISTNPETDVTFNVERLKQKIVVEI